MTRCSMAVLAAATMLAGPLAAQTQPYSAIQDRPIKALSAEEIAGLRAGNGMAMALPAELNRYPGPLHALENAAALGLTADQIAALNRQRDAMRSEAIALGEQVIAGEGELDGLFKSGTVDAVAIERLTMKLGELRGRLRAVHLRTHLDTRATLTETQIAAYQALRGYDAASGHPAHKH
jgi:hypothetical protein